MLKNESWLVVIVSVVVLFCGLKADAQQTIFNVPNADATPKGHLYLEEEGQFRGWNPDAFYVGTTYAAYGIGHNTELDVSAYNYGSPDVDNMTIGAGFKSAIPIPGLKEKYPKREYKITVGSEMLFGVEGNGVGNWTYGHLSGRVPKLNTRLSAGLSYGTRQLFGENTFCFMGGIEQPVTKKVSLLADWYSGLNHSLGLFIVGGSYALPKNTTLYAGYQFPNSENCGASGFVVEMSKLF